MTICVRFLIPPSKAAECYWGVSVKLQEKILSKTR